MIRVTLAGPVSAFAIARCSAMTKQAGRPEALPGNAARAVGAELVVLLVQMAARREQPLQARSVKSRPAAQLSLGP